MQLQVAAGFMISKSSGWCDSKYGKNNIDEDKLNAIDTVIANRNLYLLSTFNEMKILILSIDHSSKLPNGLALLSINK